VRAEQAGGERSAKAGCTGGDDRARLGCTDFVQPTGELVPGDVQRTGDVAALPFVEVADIEQRRRACSKQRRGFGRFGLVSALSAIQETDR
jgi:hypothetical protein